MGNSSTDSFFTETPAVAVAALRRSYSYYWIDPKIHKTLENKAYLQILKELVPISPFDHWEALSTTVNAITSTPPPRICVISSSSLPTEAYAWMQAEKKIAKVILFCGSEERAALIKASYPKVSHCFINLEDVISEIRFLQAEDTQSLHFFCQEEKSRLNQWMHNWFALQQLTVRDRGKEDFKQLMNVIASGELKRFDKEYNLNKSEADRQGMVLEWIKTSNFFLQGPAEMMAKVRDTFSLALVRLPFFDIYNSLKTCYACKSYPDMQAYTRISINAHELARLKAGGFQYVYFATFLVCETDPGRKSFYINEFRITLRLKKKPSNADFMDCSGYYFDEGSKRVFLNIDLPFKLLEVDLQKREIVVEMVHVPKGDVEQEELTRLQLHRKFIRYIAKIIPGQLLPSYHNDQLSVYRKQLKNEMEILHETTNVDVSYRMCMRKLEMAKLKLYYHLESEEAVQKEVLEAKELSLKVNIHNSSPAVKIKIYLFLMEINLRMNDFLKYGKCNARLKQIFEQSPNDFTEEEASKHKVYCIYCYVSTNKTQLQENLEKVKQIELLYSNRQREDSRVSELYFLIMLTKIKCEELLGNLARALSLFNQLLENISTCQGRNEVYRYYESLKQELRLREWKRNSEKEREQIKKRIVSGVLLQELPKDPLPINFSIDEQLFGVHDYSSYFN